MHVCAPANVTFTAPAGTTSANWNFGAFGTFNTNTGGFNVVSPTSFVASFSGVVNGSPTTFSSPVSVHPKPVSKFAVNQPSSDCVVKTVTLTDQSTSTSTITGWLWTYGDGGSGISGGTHTYGYTLPGTFSVTLKVTDIYGCDNQSTIGPINVTTPPTAVISANPPFLVSCLPTFSAVFSASNSVGSNMSYSWNFGNGQTSSQVTTGPITFTQQPAAYPVTLVVSANGCTASTAALVTVTTPTLSAAVSASTCTNAAPVATLLSNVSITSWDLGNGTVIPFFTPPATNPTVAIPSYTAPGVYTITVNAGSGQCTMSPQTFTIAVQQVSVDFVTSSGIICNPPVAIGFSNTSSPNATQLLWTYTDQNAVTYTSNAANPTFTFNFNSVSPYAINSVPYSPLVTLSASSTAGCSGTISKASHSLMPPTAWFYKNKREGCGPLNVTFFDTSYAFPANPIKSYTWNNGATPPTQVSGVTVPIPSQLFTYTANGIYRPFLVVETVLGCRDTSFIDTVIVASPPAVSFSFFPAQVCPNQPVQIVNTTPGSVTVQHWHVESDDGFFSGCVSDGNPSWLFTHVGAHNFTLSGYQNSCKGTAVSLQSVMVTGPVARVRHETNCINRKSVTFFSHLQEVQTATINFGDNSTALIAGNASGVVSHSVVHTYSSTGDYIVTLTGINIATGCAPSVHTLQVKVRDAAADFTVPAVLCGGAATIVTAITSTDALVGCDRGYVWYLDDGPPGDSENPVKMISFTGSGTHSVTLMIKDINSCTSTLTRTLSVSEAAPDFSLSANPICMKDSLKITNITSQIPDSIVSYTWNFGNGLTYTTSQLAVPMVAYTLASIPSSQFTILLTAVNKKGCSKTKSRSIQVNLADADFGFSPTGCIPPNTPTTITFIANSSQASYTLYYGSPSSSLVTSNHITTHTFMPGVYSITMNVQDNSGCFNSSTKTISPTQIPVANFTFSSPGSQGGNSICSPNIVSFTNITTPFTYTPSWTIGSSPVLPVNVVTFPFSSNSTTVVSISMSVSSGEPYHCSSNVTKSFTVYVAKAEIATTKTLLCLGDEVGFSVDSTDGGGLKAWVWDFGDASSTSTIVAGTTTPAPLPHTYTNFSATANGDVRASLIYYSSAYACRYAVEKDLKIIRVTGSFDRNSEATLTDTIHCRKIPDQLQGNGSVNHPSDIKYHWLVGGSTLAGSLQNVVLPFAGIHSISLTMVESANNCSATAVKNITIHPLPEATISPGEYCPDSPFTITVSTNPGVVSGTWSPAAGIVGSPVFTVDSTIFYSTGINSVSTGYSLQITNSDACVSDTIVQNLDIILPAPRVDWDTAVIVGEPVPINAYVGAYHYTWSPVFADLSCTLCANPVSTSTNSIQYTVIVEDSLRCVQTLNTYSIEILPKTSVDVPKMFTPNGDGKNDVIFVDGWGIKKLNYFRIFNRWGQLIFETDDIHTGWDGKYNGIPQNIETYVYQVSVETYIDAQPLLKSSTFKLVR